MTARSPRNSVQITGLAVQWLSITEVLDEDWFGMSLAAGHLPRRWLCMRAAEDQGHPLRFAWALPGAPHLGLVWNRPLRG